MIREIAGRQNHSLKLARKLQKKKYRRERGLLVAEGLDLLCAAIAAQAEVCEVLVRGDLLYSLPEKLRTAAQAEALDIGVCSAELLAEISVLGGAADVIFTCREPRFSLNDLDASTANDAKKPNYASRQRLNCDPSYLPGQIPSSDCTYISNQGPLLFLQKVGDPGNVGTLVRSAVAFAASGVVCSCATADPYSPKALRAGMGAQFLMPIVTEVTVADLQAWLQKRVAQVLVADAKVGTDIRDIIRDSQTSAQTSQFDVLAMQANAQTVKPTSTTTQADDLPANAEITILVLGAEREGPGEEWSPEKWPGLGRVRIHQQSFDSLNVAMAGTILLYELARS